MFTTQPYRVRGGWGPHEIEKSLCQTPAVPALDPRLRYERGDYGIAAPVVSQFAAFNHIFKRFIADGAVDEINIG